MQEKAESSGAGETEISQKELDRRILKIIWPVTLDSILMLSIGLVTSALVGRLPEAALAISAVGLSQRITQISWALFGGLATGTTVLVARAIGAKDDKGARYTAVNAISLTLILVLLLTALAFPLAEPILRLLNAEGELLRVTLDYLSIALFALPFLATMQIIAGVARGMGDTRTPMIISFFVNLLNALAGWTLIYGRFGFAAMGVTGAAVAIVFSQAIGAILALIYISSKIGIGLRLRDFLEATGTETMRILRVGLPASAEMLFWQMATMVMMGLLVTFGEVSVSAHQLGLQAEGISYMPGVGFGIAATTLLGHSFGAKNPGLAKRYFRRIVSWGVAVSFFTSLIMFFFNIQLMSAFTNSWEIIELGAFYLWLMSFTQIPYIFNSTIAGALRSSGDVRSPMYIAGAGMWGIRIPLSFIMGASISIGNLSFGLNLGVKGVWYAMTIDIFIRLILSIWRYTTIRWDKVKEI